MTPPQQPVITDDDISERDKRRSSHRLSPPKKTNAQEEDTEKTDDNMGLSEETVTNSPSENAMKALPRVLNKRDRYPINCAAGNLCPLYDTDDYILAPFFQSVFCDNCFFPMHIDCIVNDHVQNIIMCSKCAVECGITGTLESELESDDDAVYNSSKEEKKEQVDSYLRDNKKVFTHQLYPNFYILVCHCPYCMALMLEGKKPKCGYIDPKTKSCTEQQMEEGKPERDESGNVLVLDEDKFYVSHKYRLPKTTYMMKRQRHLRQHILEKNSDETKYRIPIVLRYESDKDSDELFLADLRKYKIQPGPKKVKVDNEPNAAMHMNETRPRAKPNHQTTNKIDTSIGGQDATEIEKSKLSNDLIVIRTQIDNIHISLALPETKDTHRTILEERLECYARLLKEKEDLFIKQLIN